MTVRIQLLGPLRAWRDGGELELGGPQQRAVLGLLASCAASGSTLSTSELIDALWGEDPPSSGNNVIQTYLKRLRRLLEPDRPPHAPSRFLQRVAGGHALYLSEVELDLVDFRRLVDTAGEAERGGDQPDAARRLGEALRLWKGAPLANVPHIGNHPTVVALSGERWAAVARYGEAMLAIGKAPEALPTLEQAAAACPLDEAAHARLIRTYHAIGNRGQAFATYHAMRRRLADELGVDPGPELAAAHMALLQDGPPPDAAASPAGAAAGDGDPPAGDGDGAVATTRPVQLPRTTAAFVGRGEQLQQLDKLLSAQPTAPAVVIAAIVGAAGIGKTTLAVHWAHQVADRFPDGQLFMNLRGFDPSGPAMSPAEALRSVLEALQVPPPRIPTSLDAQAGLYRSLVAGRRMLILLDNALDTDQVRPLLPGTPGCFVLVTSRNQLTGLVAEAAHPINLDLLSADEARGLLAHRLGTDRLTAQPQATDELIEHCGGLPLALAIVAARAASHPQFRLAALADELHQTAGDLDGYTTGEATTDLRAVFSWSYHALDQDPAKMFRLLSCHPGPDFSVPAAASLAGVPVHHARRTLATLSRTHLVVAHSPGRYAFHDLLRAYASELATSLDSRAERREAQHRLLDHYLHTGYRGALLLEPHRTRIALPPPRPGATIVDLADHRQAQGWFATELAGLLGATTLAAGHGFDRHAWQLPWTLVTFLDRRAHWPDLATTLHTAVEAATRLGDQRAQATAHHNLVYAYGHQQRFEDALGHAERSFGIYDQLGDRTGRAHVHRAVSWISERRRRYEEGLHHDRRALELFRGLGHRTGEASALNAIGWDYALLGEHQQTLAHCRQALPIFEEIGDLYGQGLTWDSIGYAHHHLGDHGQAIACYQTALELFREIGERYYEAGTQVHLGDAYHAISDAVAARAAWSAALTILTDIGYPDADQVRTKLAAVAEPGVAEPAGAEPPQPR